MRILTVATILSSAFLIAACGGSDQPAPVGPVDNTGGLSNSSPDLETPGQTDPNNNIPDLSEGDNPGQTDPNNDIPDPIDPGAVVELPLPWGSDQPFSGSLIDLDSFPTNQIISGGVSKDGIPALSNPFFVSPSGVSYLAEDDLVLGLVINGEARAYPHNIGWWHEIINDQIGGKAICVTFCPLTGTGLVFEAEDENGPFELGVSGLLYNNNLIMYDRRDNNTLYPQIYFTAIEGERTSESLTLMPVVETTWATWKQLHPDTKVIEGGTYSQSRYTSYPYGTYRTNNGFLLFGLNPAPQSNSNPWATTYEIKDMVLGVRLNGEPKAYPFADMGTQAVINDRVGGVDIVVVWDRAGSLAIPYARTINGQSLTFAIEQSNNSLSNDFLFNLRDSETNTLWDLNGRAIEGELEGAQLTQVPAHNSFWFAWVTFWENTQVWQR